MTRTGKYPEEIRREAVRLVRAHRDEYDSEWAAITSVASKFGAVPQTVHSWVRRADVDEGVVDGVSPVMNARRSRISNARTVSCGGPTRFSKRPRFSSRRSSTRDRSHERLHPTSTATAQQPHNG